MIIYQQYLQTSLPPTVSMQEADNITQTRNSTQQPSSFWLSFKTYLCPCLLPKQQNQLTITVDSHHTPSSVNSKTSETNHSNNHYRHKQTFEVSESIAPNRNTRRKNSMEYQENQKKQVLLNRRTIMFDKEMRETINIQLGYNNRMRSIDQNNWPVSQLNQDVLIPAGGKNRQILIKVSKVNIHIKLSLLKKEIANKKKKTEKIQQKKYGQFQFNKYWDQRYILFEKFDQGIKIDENSWTINPPQQISQYIANKCNGAKIILDAFAGVGGNAIKLANVNSCKKVIASEQNKKKMGFLLNNAKVYQVDSNIELNQDGFMKLERQGIDVVFAQPQLAQFHLPSNKDITITDFQPTLDKIILKSFKLAPNLIILLPPDISIDSICNCIHKCAIDSKRMKDFCSIKIEKICCQNKVKFILVLIGTLVQTEVKLNDELEYLYTRLKKNGEVYFKHKKVLKKIREDYGMLELFNLVKQSQRRKKDYLRDNDSKGKQQFTIDFFYELIRERSLIPADRLMKIIAEQDAEYQRQSSYFHSITFDDNEGMSPMMEEEKIDENPFNMREAELTQSQYSHYSYFSSYDKKSSNSKSHRSSSRIMRQGQKSVPSVIINRINDSKEKNQGSFKADSPLTPKSKGRISQIAQPKAQNSPTRQ